MQIIFQRLTQSMLSPHQGMEILAKKMMTKRMTREVDEDTLRKTTTQMIRSEGASLDMMGQPAGSQILSVL